MGYDKNFEGSENPIQQRTAAILSFLLPGLGQIHEGHYRRGLGLFVAFSLLASITEARLLLPLAALLAAAEAYRGKVFPLRTSSRELPVWLIKILQRDKISPYRTWLYGIVASLGFCLWIGLVLPVLYPFSVQAALNDQVDLLADRVRAYEASHHELPKNLAETLQSEDNPQQVLTDPWGMPYQFSTNDDGFVIISGGKDKRPGTADDYRFQFR